MSDKIWLSADQLLEDSFRLANLILDSGFRPTHLVGIWRGGAPVGIAVQELLEFNGVDCDHIAIRTSAYAGIDEQKKEVRVFALSYLVSVLSPDDRLLVIDDVFDTGRSVEAFLDALRARCRANMPAETRVATVYFKPRRNQTAMTPDYFVHACDDWLVFPHEVCGLRNEEIRAHKPQADLILARK